MLESLSVPGLEYYSVANIGEVLTRLHAVVRYTDLRNFVRRSHNLVASEGVEPSLTG